MAALAILSVVTAPVASLSAVTAALANFAVVTDPSESSVTVPVPVDPGMLTGKLDNDPPSIASASIEGESPSPAFGIIR